MKIKYEDDDRQYLQMMQENIARMAGNSANCKTWMVTLVAGLLAITCGVDNLKGWIILAVLPTIAFWYLDVFYLHLERKMRNRELDFILKAKSLAAATDEEQREARYDAYNKALYNFAPLVKDTLTEDEEKQGYVKTNDRWFSESEWTFYVCVIVVILVVIAILNLDAVSSVWS